MSVAQVEELKKEVERLQSFERNPRPTKLYKSDGSAIALSADANGDLTAIGDLIVGSTSKGIVQGVWFDDALADDGNASGITSHFKDNDSSFPDGWTATDAAFATSTNQKYSFWFLRGASTDVSWKYRRQSSINIESSTANFFQSFQFGPIIFRDGDYTADIDYFFGMYRDNAGAIDETTFSRVRLWWDSAATLWKIRGEANNGGVQSNGTTITLDQAPLPQPMYIRFLVRNDANKNTRQYFGTTPFADTHQLLQSVNKSATWGAVWIQAHQTRGAGIEDYLYLGALDFQENTP